ncbi:unnamed protein product [Acidithrix sp. C25]|nr:unnamed protein product [Acidithrix sp. C25]
MVQRCTVQRLERCVGKFVSGYERTKEDYEPLNFLVKVLARALEIGPRD